MGAEKAAKKARTEAEKKRRLIVERMKKLGLYKAQYGAAIDRLAEMYVQMDDIKAQYSEDGGKPVVEHTNKAGAANLQINPYLQALLQIHTQALAHERELGLTPAALRKLTDSVGEKPKKSPLELALEKLGSG